MPCDVSGYSLHFHYTILIIPLLTWFLVSQSVPSCCLSVVTVCPSVCENKPAYHQRTCQMHLDTALTLNRLSVTWRNLNLRFNRILFKGGSSAGAPPPPPPSVWNFVGFVLENFDSLTRLIFIVISMHKYIILYSSIGYVWRGIKTISGPRKLYRAGTATPPLFF